MDSRFAEATRCLLTSVDGSKVLFAFQELLQLDGPPHPEMPACLEPAWATGMALVYGLRQCFRALQSRHMLGAYI